MKLWHLAGVGIIMIGMYACSSFGIGPATITPELTATPDLSATQDSRIATETQGAENFQATQDKQVSQTAAVEETGTAFVIATKVQERRNAQATETQEKILLATVQAQPVFDNVQKLYEEGQISSTEGNFYFLADFTQSWPQINFFRFWYTDLQPKDFVLRADISWESASSTANWFNSGCGFGFRVDEEFQNYYVVFLTMDGFVKMSRWKNGVRTSLGRSYYGTVGTPSGSAEMMLVVEGDILMVFVNGKRVHRRSDSTLESGYVTYSLVSGTNKDYGTRCTFSNVGLWDFDPNSERLPTNGGVEGWD